MLINILITQISQGRHVTISINTSVYLISFAFYVICIYKRKIYSNSIAEHCTSLYYCKFCDTHNTRKKLARFHQAPTYVPPIVLLIPILNNKDVCRSFVRPRGIKQKATRQHIVQCNGVVHFIN